MATTTPPESNPYTTRERERLLTNARHQVRTAALELAKAGLSTGVIRAVMKDIANEATKAAVAYAEREDAAEALRQAVDREDLDDRKVQP